MQKQPHIYPPLGLLYIAGYLRNKGLWEVEVFDCTFVHDESEFAASLRRSQPDIVGIQSTITTRDTAKTMIELAKQMGTTVVVGGPDPTVSWHDYLDWGADFVAAGEGEVTMLELMRHLYKGDISAAKAICGIAHCDGSTYVRNTPRAFISNLDSVPWPALDIIDIEPYLHLWKQHHGYSELHLITSRGCPFT